MAPGHAGITSDIEQLNQLMRELEQRVSALESLREKQTSAGPEPAAGPAQIHPLASPQLFPSRNLPVAAVPVLGKAVLGIAGAYLLRAIFESGRVPQWPVLAVAVLYAATWLIWAVKSHATSQFASVTYGITVALIFMPFLWECTVRFQILPPPVTAAVLVAFVVFAMALAWRQDLQAIPWIATLAAIATALALIVATHELVALTAALLVVALMMEVAASLGHRLSVRAVSAIAADFAVWLLADIATSDGGVPPGYAPISTFMLTTLCFALLAIYGGSIGIRSLALRERLTILDIAQGAVAFLIAAWGTLRASHGASAPALGGFSLVVATVCYWGALSRFNAEADTRNRRVYAVYAAALLLAGSFLLLPANLQELFLCLAAIAAAFMYSQYWQAQPRLAYLRLSSSGSVCFASPAVCKKCAGGNCTGKHELVDLGLSGFGGALLPHRGTSF